MTTEEYLKQIRRDANRMIQHAETQQMMNVAAKIYAAATKALQNIKNN